MKKSSREKNTVIAICPSCQTTHKTKLKYEWRGNGVPRVYCPGCKKGGKSSNRGVRVFSLR